MVCILKSFGRIIISEAEVPMQAPEEWELVYLLIGFPAYIKDVGVVV
jgi:hypothetical protein